ncbi:MAG TPA: glycosyltransferase [Acidimicrobiales bacterium]|nr:glycosyltransferase [Acidimicrobiales bacterium]
MKVLCSSTPMEGVFGPFVPLGKALLAAGHDVVVAIGPDLEDRVRREGFTTAAAGPTAMEGAMAAMADPASASAPEGEHWHFGGAMFGAVIAPAKLPALRELADAYRPDLIVHAPVDLAAPLLAAERGLPSATYGFGQPLEPVLVAALAERVAPLWRSAGLDPDPCAGIYRGRYLDPCPPSLQPEPGPAAAVAQPIRPEIPGDPNAPLPEWSGALGSRPVVYLSLGTVPFFNQPDRFNTLLAALAHEDIELVVTISEMNDPAALAAQPPNVHIERWLPLAPLLPRCDAVVCHAGSGTTLAALTAGLPLVLVPQGADQHTNAEACHRAGVARVLAGEAVTSTSVRDAVMAVLDRGSPERDVAHRIAREIASMPPAADVVPKLVDLAGATAPAGP